MEGVFSLEPAELKTRRTAKSVEVWDPFRRQWAVLSPEEFVRQAVLQRLVQMGLLTINSLSVEKEITVEGRARRYDAALILNEKVRLAFEFKAPQVKLSQHTLDQVSRYNRELNAPFLVLSNGEQTLLIEQNEEHQKSILHSDWNAFWTKVLHSTP